MFNSIFGITPISDTMWSLLFLGFIGSVIYGLVVGVIYFFKNK
jgi:hypothetical protein